MGGTPQFKGCGEVNGRNGSNYVRIQYRLDQPPGQTRFLLQGATVYGSPPHQPIAAGDHESFAYPTVGNEGKDFVRLRRTAEASTLEAWPRARRRDAGRVRYVIPSDTIWCINSCQRGRTGRLTKPSARPDTSPQKESSISPHPALRGGAAAACVSREPAVDEDLTQKRG